MASRSGFAGSGAGSETESGTLPALPSAFSTLLRITSLRAGRRLVATSEGALESPATTSTRAARGRSSHLTVHLPPFREMLPL
eukprot:1997341-Pyramimonas_sp.AAC.1